MLDRSQPCRADALARRPLDVVDLSRGLLALAVLALTVCAGTAGAAPEAGEVFADATAAAGLDFVHWNGMTGDLYFPEMTGSGAALFDYDRDGDLDAYLVQGAMLDPARPVADALVPPPARPGGRLYRNDLTVDVGGRSVPRFVDVTEASGLRAAGYGMGVATGDFDNDGWTDLYLTHVGANQLLRNRGDGTFEDVTAQAGVGDPGWGTSAAVLDFDRDGWLDLYVVNYVRFDVAQNVRCYAPSSRRDYCGPSAFQPAADVLYRNRGAAGDGGPRFADVSAAAGIARQPGAGLGVVAADFDGDGWLDVYVANDGEVNFLWLNQRDGTFRDDALLAGVAVNRAGRPEASMGVDAGDFDNDGDLDLFMTHLTGETNTLYVNAGGGLFEDRTSEAGLTAGSLAYTSFGTGWLDYDHDGWLDLLIANGAVKILEPLARAGDPYPLDQPNQLFHNRGGTGFDDVTAQAGEAFRRAEVSRGVALGDVDHDGDVDALLSNNDGPARLLLNRAADGRPWLGVRLQAQEGGRDPLGARVGVERRAAPALWRRVASDGSYCSASDPRVVVGLGAGGEAEAVAVRWLDGRVDRWLGPPADRYLTLRQPAPCPTAAAVKGEPR